MAFGGGPLHPVEQYKPFGVVLRRIPLTGSAPLEEAAIVVRNAEEIESIVFCAGNNRSNRVPTVTVVRVGVRIAFQPGSAGFGVLIA